MDFPAQSHVTQTWSRATSTPATSTGTVETSAEGGYVLVEVVADNVTLFVNDVRHTVEITQDNFVVTVSCDI